MRALALAIAVVATLTACGADKDASTSATPTESPTPEPVATTRPAWVYPLAADFRVQDIASADGVVMIADSHAIVGLDATSGRLRWRKAGLTSNSEPEMALGDGFAANHAYGVTRFSPATGATIWTRANICKSSVWHAVVSALTVSGPDLFVGCRGGRIARLDRASGRTLAVSDAFATDAISEIRALGTAGIAVSGWSAGAILRFELGLFGRDDLHLIMPAREDTSILGAIGDAAVLDDTCCFGRPDVYRPATIVRVDLARGTATKRRDLRPEPDHFPANARPLGQGATAELVGTRVILKVEDRLYDGGDALALYPEPVRLLPNAELGDFIGPDYIDAGVTTEDGVSHDTILDLRSREPSIVWQSGTPSRAHPDGVPGRDPAVVMMWDTPNDFAGRFVRLRDGTTVTVSDIGAYVSDGRAVYVAAADGTGMRVVKYVFPD